MVSDLGAAMASAARALHTPVSLDDTLAAIARTAQLSLPDFDAVGISTLDRKGKPETRAATGDLVWELDRIQYELDEGPCVDTLREGKTGVVIAPRLAHDQRWPRYVPQALERGLKSQLAVKLHLDDEGTVGGLNLYSTTDEDIDDETESIAELFAIHAAIALGNAREVDTLNEALRTRKMIGQAVGMLMHEYTLTEDAAFGFLVRTSSHANIKLRDVAATMIERAEARAKETNRRER